MLVRALIPVIGALVWFDGLASVDNVRALTPLGLVSVLPVPALIGLIVISLSFADVLTRPHLEERLLAFHVAVLIVMLYAATSVYEEVPRSAVAYRHFGIAGQLAATGTIDRNIDAYFNWPGFFAAGAFLERAIGVTNATAAFPAATWAPLFFNALSYGVLYLLFTSVTENRRYVWLALWIYFSANWVFLDYLSPQALGYFFYLLIITVLIRYFPSANSPSADAALTAGSEAPRAAAPRLSPFRASLSSGQRTALLGVVIVLFAAVVPSHQLTPPALVAAVAALVVTNAVRVRALPILMAVIVATWVLYAAAPFVQSQAHSLASGIGSVGTNVGESVTHRIGGQPAHLFVVLVRVALSLAVWALALFGAIRVARGRTGRGLVALGCVPLGLFLFQAYGGEIAVRVFYFTLPVAAFFAAAFVVTLFGSSRRITALLVSLLSIALLSGLMFARYGNEQLDEFTHNELNAFTFLYGSAPRGSLILQGSINAPAKFEGYAGYQYEMLTDSAAGLAALDRQNGSTAARARLVQVIKRELANGERLYGHAYLVITRSMEPWAEFGFGTPKGALSQLPGVLASTRGLRVVYRNRDAIIVVPEDTAKP